MQGVPGSPLRPPLSQFGFFSTGWRQGWSICVLLEVHRRFLGTPKVQEMFSAMVDVIWMWESWVVAD